MRSVYQIAVVTALIATGAVAQGAFPDGSSESEFPSALDTPIAGFSAKEELVWDVFRSLRLASGISISTARDPRLVGDSLDKYLCTVTCENKTPREIIEEVIAQCPGLTLIAVAPHAVDVIPQTLLDDSGAWVNAEVPRIEWKDVALKEVYERAFEFARDSNIPVGGEIGHFAGIRGYYKRALDQNISIEYGGGTLLGLLNAITTAAGPGTTWAVGGGIYSLSELPLGSVETAAIRTARNYSNGEAAEQHVAIELWENALTGAPYRPLANKVRIALAGAYLGIGYSGATSQASSAVPILEKVLAEPDQHVMGDHDFTYMKAVPWYAQAVFESSNIGTTEQKLWDLLVNIEENKLYQYCGDATIASEILALYLYGKPSAKADGMAPDLTRGIEFLNSKRDVLRREQQVQWLEQSLERLNELRVAEASRYSTEKQADIDSTISNLFTTLSK